MSVTFGISVEGRKMLYQNVSTSVSFVTLIVLDKFTVEFVVSQRNNLREYVTIEAYCDL